MSSVDHFHMEAELMTGRQHLGMLCTQFSAISLQLGDPSYRVVTLESGLWQKKQTILRRFYTAVTPFLSLGDTVTDAKPARKEIHTAAVRQLIMARRTIRLLGETAPAVDSEEEKLARKSRRTMAQLRSWFCLSLNDYRHRITQSDICAGPSCREEEHTVTNTQRFCDQRICGCTP